MIQTNGRPQTFDITMGCEGCQSRKEYLLAHKLDLLLLGGIVALIGFMLYNESKRNG